MRIQYRYGKIILDEETETDYEIGHIIEKKLKSEEVFIDYVDKIYCMTLKVAKSYGSCEDCIFLYKPLLKCPSISCDNIKFLRIGHIEKSLTIDDLAKKICNSDMCQSFGECSSSDSCLLRYLMED